MSDVVRAVHVSPNTLYRDLQGEAVLLQLESGEYFGLDEVGNRIWQLMTTLGDLDLIAKALIDEYDAEPDVIVSDLHRIVQELADNKLVEVELAATR